METKKKSLEVKAYHIHTSMVHGGSTNAQHAQYRPGYWGIVVTNNEDRVITTAKEMYNKMIKECKYEDKILPQLIISILLYANESKESNGIQELFLRTDPKIENLSVEDLIYDNDNKEKIYEFDEEFDLDIINSSMMCHIDERNKYYS